MKTFRQPLRFSLAVRFRRLKKQPALQEQKRNYSSDTKRESKRQQLQAVLVPLMNHSQEITLPSAAAGFSGHEVARGCPLVKP